MLKALDSAYPPSDKQLEDAKAKGIKVWSGYLPGPNILHGWTPPDFQRVRNAGLGSIGFASGWEDPAQAARVAAEYGVLGCVDLESGIRAAGSWTQGWLDKSGFGQYANPSVKLYRAPFHIAAAYPDYDPRETWPSGYRRPSGPCGWQWKGTHTEFGISVDSSWLDDWFLGDDMDQPTFDKMFKQAMKDLLKIDADNLECFGQGGMGVIDNAKVLGKDGQTARAGVKSYLAGLGSGTAPAGVPPHKHGLPTETGDVVAG